MGKRYSLALFDEENKLFAAIKYLQENQIIIYDVYSPYPVHNLEKALGKKRSRLPIIAFVAGFIGGSSALFFQIWSLLYYWPHNIGGKPALSIPSFIPVAFEVTILGAAFTMIGSFFFRNKLYPRFKTKVFDIRATNNLHCLVIENINKASDHNFLVGILNSFSPTEVIEKKEDDL